MPLTNQRAIVCGASGGIGLAAARGLAAAGASVLLLARSETKLAAAEASLHVVPSARHGRLVADLNHAAATRDLVAGWLERNGPAHILVNNTGGPPGGPILDATADAFTAAFEGHLLTSHLLAQAVVPGMRQAGHGRIINVVSTSVRQPIPGLGVSNTTRGAVASWAKTLAGEVGRFGITVNNVLPGATRTARLASILEARSTRTGAPLDAIEREMEGDIPLGRFGTADEIAAAIVFLAGPGASYITGVSLAVDGGRTSAL